MTVVHGNAPWDTCRRHAGYLAMHVYKHPPPPGVGFSTRYPDRVAEVEEHWEDWEVLDNHDGSGLVARLYKLKSYDPEGDNSQLCPPCLAFRGTDFHDLRGLAIAASIRWRIFRFFGWTHDFTVVLDETVPPKTSTPGRHAAARGAPTVEVPYTRDELIDMAFRPFPIFHEEGATEFETAADGETFEVTFRVGLDLLAREDGDWVANILQGLGRPTPQYEEAISFGQQVIDQRIATSTDNRLEITGHSLGGSLAAAVACVLDRTYPDFMIHGMTFNAAGVHPNTVAPASLGEAAIHNFTVEDEGLTTVHTFTDRLPVIGSIFRLAERTINQVGMPPAIGQLIVQRGTWPPGTTHPTQVGTGLPNLFPIEDQTFVPEYTGDFPILTLIDNMLIASGDVGRFASRFLEWLNATYREQAVRNNRDSDEDYWFPERIDRTYTEMMRLLMEELDPEIDALMKIVAMCVNYHGMDYVIAAYDAKFGRP